MSKKRRITSAGGGGGQNKKVMDVLYTDARWVCSAEFSIVDSFSKNNTCIH